MVWIQVWTDAHEFIRSDTIESIYYRLLKKGQSEDWVEILARPRDAVILQFPVNAGNFPKTVSDQKTWLRLVEARASQVMAEVIQAIDDPAQKSKMISLKDIVSLDFEQEAPRNLEIEVWVWNIPCHNCHKETPVVYPVGAFFGYMLEFNFLSNLPLLLAEKFPFFKKGSSKGKEGEEYRNACINCGEPQPDWRVMESYMELANTPGIVKEKSKLTVPLTEEEKVEYKKAGMSSTW
jgi:hypothetical protein